MPNRADHSVKTRRRDRARGLKTWPIVLGVVAAVIGALTVMFAGGAAGRVFGAGLLTTIIFLQIFLRVISQNAPESAEKATIGDDQAPVDGAVFSDAPVLILHISPLGRVRAMFGSDDLWPDLAVGTEFTDDLAEIEARGLMRLPTVDESWVILVPTPTDENRESGSDRTSFFAGLGHDLKSPLNAVIGFAEIMDTELRGPMPDAYKDYPGLIKESGEALLRLVEDMLAYAKSEAGTYELDPTAMDIAASGESVLRQSQAVADKAGVKLRFIGDGEALAWADADAVRRIWDNLVSNAIKYSATGDVVTLTAKSHGKSCLIQVSDTGAGMDAEDLARIAKPFAQGRNAKGRAGTGLGLAMVQRLAELQGGQVEIRTALGAGTTVIVRLPAAIATDRRAAE